MGNSTLIRQGRVFRFVTEDYALPDGRIATIDKVEHPGAVVILPFEPPNKLFLIRQYRRAVQDTIYEFPAGTLEVGEKPLACAKREIKEEIGKQANHWKDLGVLLPAPGFCDEIQHCYFASELEEAMGEKDSDEQIEVVVHRLAEVELLIKNGELKDGKSLAIFLRARLLGLI